MRYGKAGIRKDSWLNWQDEKLRDIVLQHARENKKQTDAFKKASLEVGKSVSACHFRWHTVLKLKVRQEAADPAAPQCETQGPADELADAPQVRKPTRRDVDFSLEKRGATWRLTIEAAVVDQAMVHRLHDIFIELSAREESA